jgi:arylsulfatase A-like enzyme
LYKDDLTNHNITADLINLHDDEIIFLDHMISKIWGTIKKLPDFDNTVVIITSDHGEHFGEKGLYAHNLSLYNELIWVPLMVKFPGALTRKGVSDRLTSLNDLYPTVLDLMNSPLPSPKSSLSLLNSSQRDLVFSQIIFPEIWQGPLRAIKERGRTFSPPMVAVINDRNNKIIQRANGEMELYDLTKDKGEDHNLVETISSEAKQNLHHLLEYLKDDTGFNETVSRIEANDITNRPFPTLDF